MLHPKPSTQEPAEQATRVNQPSQAITSRGQPRCMLKTRAAAAHIGTSKSFLDKARCTGDGPPFYKIGSSVIYDEADLDEYMAARKRRSTSDRGSSDV
jgi:predicted DNA-binding transcriptional regulator AlpA